MKRNNLDQSPVYLGIIVFLVLMAMLYSHWVQADDKDKPKIVEYQIVDGYGTYKGEGKKKVEAESEARKKCILTKVGTFEAEHGYTPTPDTVDLFIDACINK